jgi:dTDP-4-amino-4,6-dideoxygalactose transaminase
VTVPFLDLEAATREVRPQLDAAIARVLDSGWYVLGSEVESFERDFAAYCGAAECVGVASGLDALVLMLRAYGIGPSDEVIVPANTYIATWLAISAVGATPVPVEPDPRTLNIDAALVPAALSPRTRAVLAVHLYGRLADMEALATVCRENGLKLLEDVAQAHGATRAGRRAGALGDAAAFSFYPGKNLGALGDAGAVVSSDAHVADRVRVLRNYGSRRKYENEVQGVNSRLDPIQAAALGVKLPLLDAWNERRRAIAARYLRGLRGLDGIRLPAPGDEDMVWHQFVVEVSDRDSMRATLDTAGVASLVHYPIPPHRSGAYAGMNWPSLPRTERLARDVLSLPIGPHLSGADADVVVAAVRSAVAELPPMALTA